MRKLVCNTIAGLGLFLVGVASAEQGAAAVSGLVEEDCQDTGDRVCGVHSSVFAISHSHTDPESTVLFRVTVPAWEYAADADGTANGLFYLATVDSGSSVCVDPEFGGECSGSKVYVPFNGVIVEDGELSYPGFTFVVPVTGDSAQLTIEACLSNYTFATGTTDPACTTVAWNDDYTSLPVPEIGLPSGLRNAVVNLQSTTVAVANNGVHTVPLTMIPFDNGTGSVISDASLLEYFYDHMVFFDGNGNPYTNDIFDGSSTDHRSLGVLGLEDAAFETAGGFRTKYGNQAPVSALSPEKRMFFYSRDADSDTIRVGVSLIYDSAADCRGFVTGSGSRDECNDFVVVFEGVGSGLSGISTAQVNPQVGQAGQIPVNALDQAGRGTSRTICFSSQPNSSCSAAGSGGLCASVANPLGTEIEGAGFAPPNYVIDRAITQNDSWGASFPRALYYVLPSGFGECDTSADAPFCQRKSGYDAYVPRYLDTGGVTGPLNGGSTSASVVSGFHLTDKYELGKSGANSTNSLLFFDNCGYGHEYVESGNALSGRETLPAAPDGYSSKIYTISNSLGHPVVLVKECCASWYQEDSDTGLREPAEQLGGGSGILIPSGGSVQYETLFKDEAAGVYDGATGALLFKLRLNGGSSVVHSCVDSASTVAASGSTINIGASGSGLKKCQTIGKCPLGMTAKQSGSLVTCSLTNSSFLFGLDDWKTQASLPDNIQLQTFSAKGRVGPQSGGSGGNHGEALTVMRPADIPDGLYAYVGKTGDDHGDGGSSTILSRAPLSLVSTDQAESTTNPAALDVWLIAGGGGGGGTKHSGGGGALAIANAAASALPGAAKSIQGNKGNNDNGGKGGNTDGKGKDGGTSAFSGVGGSGRAGWNQSGPLIPPSVDPLDWKAGQGSHGNGCSGGAGFGGGAHGSTNAAGCGGGGSWAVGNTAHDSTLPTGRTASPGGDQGGVAIAYVMPTVQVAPAATETGSLAATSGVGFAGGEQPRNVVRFIYDPSVEPLALLSAIERIFGSDVSGDVPVYVEAWGGAGAAAGPATAGGSGGAGGYARSGFTLSELASISPDGDLYLYIGEGGAGGLEAGESGQGGASTIVASKRLSGGSVGTDPATSGIVLIAGGGGGGGGGTSTDDPQAGPGGGGDGGRAVAGIDAAASCGGGDASGPRSGDEPEEFGGGGNGGGGSCESSAAGAPGRAGAGGGVSGVVGVGGYGGATAVAPDLVRWRESSAVIWIGGAGATSPTLGGAGGGGFGGGGSGGESLSLGEGGGGGGGGSWARQASVEVDESLLVGSQSPIAGNGAVALTFDICGIHPDLDVCAPGGDFSVISSAVRVFDQTDGELLVRLEGNALVDVTAIDSDRLAFGHTLIAPSEVFEPTDVDGNGTDDLEMSFVESGLGGVDDDAVHCLYGVLGDGAPFVGCGRVEAAACSACPRADCVDGACVGDEPSGDRDDDSCAIVAGSTTGRGYGGFLPLMFGCALVLLRSIAHRAASKSVATRTAR